DGSVDFLDVESVEPYTAQARHFVDCLDAGAAVTEGTGYQGYTAAAVAAAALHSTATGAVEAVTRIG
ncbi:MAG: hypothetical protein ACRDTS_20655, partial [Mycobacterium sp.]